MLIKITDKCSMGCTHCLSDCKPDGKHMSFKTFKDAIDFNDTIVPEMNIFGTPCVSPALISGGEPFEHPDVIKFINYLILKIKSDSIKHIGPSVIITTNGDYISKNTNILDYIITEVGSEAIQFQVCIDDRYYPTHINEDNLKDYKNVRICYGVTSIYPQGRAIDNNLPYSRKSSSCYNVRALAKQFGAHDNTFDFIFSYMLMKGHVICCPHIDIYGNIKVGESRLCPICSSIYKTHEEIAQDIINFKCHQCDFINSKLTPEYRKYVE